MDVPIYFYKVNTLSNLKPNSLVALKTDGDTEFSLYITDKSGAPYPIKDTGITNTDGSLIITGGIDKIINLNPTLEGLINSALQSGDNISELVNDSNFITLGDVPTFDPLNYDLAGFTNLDADPFAKISDIVVGSGITSIVAGTNVTIDNTNPLNPIINSTPSNLSYTPSSTNGTITSDTGTDATLTVVDGTNAGLVTPSMKSTWDAKQEALGFTPYNATNPAGYISSYNETDPLALKLANNLSDLIDTATARTNLGLGSLATQNGTFSDKVDKVTGESLINDSEITRLSTVTNYDNSSNVTALSSKADKASIAGATKTKITYNSQGIVTNGVDATTADIADSTNKRYVTDANLITIVNQSGTNTGDQNLSGYQLLSEKDAISGYAGLDGSGKINPLQLPALAITNTFIVATQVAMLALTAEVGDIAVRTDLNKSYILRVTGATTLANWQELLTPTDAVSSVFGRSGSVTAQSNDYTADQILETSTRVFVTTAEKADITHTNRIALNLVSGNNTGDNATNSQYSGLASSKYDASNPSNYQTASQVQTIADTKVDKVTGKSLILDTEITRLSSVSNFDNSSNVTALSGKVDKITPITGSTKTKITYNSQGQIISGADATQDDILDGSTNRSFTNTEKTKLTGIATGANVGVLPNTAITGATKTKITYDSKGLITSGADATTADIASSTDKRYQTDTQQTNNDATSSIQTQFNEKQPLATVLTNTTASFTTAQETKLAGVATGATANSSDATLLNRANHTGTQLASTISDIQNTITNNTAVLANTAKISFDSTSSTRLAGTSGTNTGDETLATIQAKLISTANLSEGTNLYFTAARVLATLLTGISFVTGGAIVSTDSVLIAFGKIQKQITDLTTSLSGYVPTTRTVNTKPLSSDVVLTTADISDSTNKRYVTDAQQIVIGNTSGTNSGDNATNSQYSGLASSKEDTANKSTSTGDSASTTKFPVWSAIVAYFTTARIKTLLGQATTSIDGWLSSTDWNTFNNKVSNATHTGDATGATALTLATVNSNIGTVGSASKTVTVTTNAKGLTTAISEQDIVIALSQVTGLTSALNTKLSIPANGADISNTTTFRTNLGLGSLATQNGTFSDKVDKVTDKSLILDTEITKLSKYPSTATNGKMLQGNGNNYVEINMPTALVQSSYTVLANNTNATALATDFVFRKWDLATYAGTITWNGTAPTTILGQSYSGQQVGNMVSLNGSIVYSNAGVSNTQVSFTLPSDFPIPVTPTGFTSAVDIVAYGSGMMTNSTNALVVTGARNCFLRRNPANTGYEIFINVSVSVNARVAMFNITYQVS